MRLKSVAVQNYKNLVNFDLRFDGNGYIDVLVGQNGSGKSNFFEALVAIFRHLFEFGNKDVEPSFSYTICYEIEGEVVKLQWDLLALNVNGKARKTLGSTPLPDNVLMYYSGHNEDLSSLSRVYEQNFQRRIKNASFDEGRRFIEVGPDYRSLLMSVILVHGRQSAAYEYICGRLQILSCGEELRVTLKRPKYAGTSRFDIEDVVADRYWRADGITKTFLDRLTKCLSGAGSRGVRAEGYFANDDTYILYLDVDAMRSEFSDFSVQDLFRQFDNLKTLGMLYELSLPVKVEGSASTEIARFSDGQYQSVYIYSILELFRDRNSLTLLDEPDSFLHPEWQFSFLKHISDISGDAVRSNHVIMSTHSAATLIGHAEKKLAYFDSSGPGARSYQVPKAIAIKKLSADLIKYSEQEQLLSIINAIQIENKPVLFTEGSTDPVIIKAAWSKLYDSEMPFIPFYAFSCTYIKQLLTDNRIHAEMGGLPIFALFDFDKAYDQWNGLNGSVIEDDPIRGLIKKWSGGESYAIMLPLPATGKVVDQVFKDFGSKQTFGGDSCCEIEHLFYGYKGVDDYFIEEPFVGGGRKIVFVGDGRKTKFAKEVVPDIEVSAFEVFRPVFEFIQGKC